VWYSDRAIPAEVAERLRVAASELENIPDAKKDWHPGSDGQVLDLVHPSLYCIVYGRTHAYLPDKPRVQSNLRVVKCPTAGNWMCSERFCWMPSDFSVDANTGSTKLLSPYINNLHLERSQAMYRIIEDVLTAFVPMFERVLGDVNRENLGLLDVTSRLGPISCIWGNYGKPCPEENLETEEEEKKFYESVMIKKELPEPGPYSEPPEGSVPPVPLRGRSIQCIVKLANIRLTPEKSEYAGGSWHVEGECN
jgi:hypothetical protein